MGLGRLNYDLSLFFHLLTLNFYGLYYILIVIVLFLCCFLCFTHLFDLLFTLGIIDLLPYSFHLFKLLHGRPLIERLLIIEAHLLEGLPQIKQSRLAFDQGKNEVTVFNLVPIPKGDVDLSKIFGDPTRIGEYLEVFGGIGPLRICFFS